MSGIEQARSQAALAAEAKRQGIPEWVAEAASATPTSLIRDIVADNRPSSAVAPSPQPRGGGWQAPRPLPLPPKHEVELIDRLAEKFCGPPNGPVK